MSSSSFAETLIPLARYKWRVFVVTTVVIACGACLYVTTPPEYSSQANLMTMAGANEYSLRPLVGETAVSNAVLQPDEVVTTETQLIEDPRLFGEVIDAVGLVKIYPSYAKAPRTGLRAMLHEAKESVHAWLHSMGFPIAPEHEPNPLELAENDFAKHLTVTWNKSSNLIELKFSHRDPRMAALVLNTLVRLYIQRRSDLYDDRQAPIVDARVERLRTELENADAALASYKAGHDIGNYNGRRDDLLHEQATLERFLQQADVSISTSEAQLRELSTQLKRIPPTLQTQRDMDFEQRSDAERRSIDELRAKLARLRSTYAPNSEVVQVVEQQLAQQLAVMDATLLTKRPSLTRQGVNPVWTEAASSVLRAEDALKEAQATAATTQRLLADVVQRIHTINQQEERLNGLERQVKVASDSYVSMMAVAVKSRLTDMAERRQKGSVRIVDPAVVPSLNSSNGNLILQASIVLGILAGVCVAVLSNYARRVYLTPQEIERDLGIAVLATIPDMPRLG